MKKCLKCNQKYSDETLNYCLEDGSTLVFEGEQETVVLSQATPAKKGKSLFWAGIIGLLIIGTIALAGVFLLYKFYSPSQNLAVQTPNNPSVSPTKKPETSPTTNPTKSPESTPKKDEVTDSSEEFVPINWRTNAYQFRGEEGQVFKFECPPDGTAAMIWGSDIYTADSSICTAAVHAGLFSLEDGGNVTIEYRPGRQIYGSTERNGITSNNYGEFDRSFVVR